MNVPVLVLILTMTVGVLLLLRATAIIATRGGGRFRADPLITMMLGFGLILLGQYLL